MKKHLFLACLTGVIMWSCQTNDVLENGNGIVEPQNETTSDFKLISDEVIDESEGLELRNSSYISEYEQSIPIYRYFYYSGDKSDHYLGLEAPSGSSRNIKGRAPYMYEAQEFNLMRNRYGSSSYPLYRHYSAALNDHKLSTSTNVSGYVSDGNMLGYVFATQQIGTVPILEYYSDLRKNHHYIVRQSELNHFTELDYKYVKTIGYVYPGERNFPEKIPSTITVKYGGQIGDWPFDAILDIKVREANIYRKLRYTINLKKFNEYGIITLNNTYKIVSADMTIVSKHPRLGTITNIFYNITRPDLRYPERDDQPAWPYNIILLNRSNNGYNAIFEISYDFIVGS